MCEAILKEEDLLKKNCFHIKERKYILNWKRKKKKRNVNLYFVQNEVEKHQTNKQKTTVSSWVRWAWNDDLD
jgi:hypothetical protein